MASNSEIIVIILDVGRNARNSVQAGINCVVEIIKEKIYIAKKDYMSFVLLGSEETQNLANDNVDSDNYLNISQYPHVLTPSWNLLLEFLNFVPDSSKSKGQWLEALVVAMQIIKSSAETHKIVHQKIILFHDFNASGNDYELFEVIVKSLKDMNIQLIVISKNIQYIDDDDGKTKAIFKENENKSSHQCKNEEFALRLVAECNAVLCNFHEARHSMQFSPSFRPWNVDLQIGTHISIHLSAIIAIKDEAFLKLKKIVTSSDEYTKTVKKYFCGANEFNPGEDDLIEGYMLGATTMPYDASLGQKAERIEKGLKFIGFVKRKLISEEYFVGNSSYWIVHRQKMDASCRMLDALVKALLAEDMTILAWKVYNTGNTPKLVILLPNNKQNCPIASLTMLEMSYYAQHLFWDFPKLRTRKTEIDDKQLDAIDKLIHAMDLSPNEVNNKETPRETNAKDLLPFNLLPDIEEQNLMNLIEKEVLKATTNSRLLAKFSKIEKEKNFWKIHPVIESEANLAAKCVKEVFPLIQSSQPTKQKLLKHFGASLDTTTNDDDGESNTTAMQKDEPLKIHRVGTVTPAEDFELLMQHIVLKISDSTGRDAKFQLFSHEIRMVIWDLLFKSLTDQKLKVAEAIKSYRKHALTLNPYDYNDWIAEMKQKIVERQMFDFWENVIIKEQLGLCFGDIIPEDREAAEAFYAISKNINSGNNPADFDDGMNEESVDDLLANM